MEPDTPHHKEEGASTPSRNNMDDVDMALAPNVQIYQTVDGHMVCDVFQNQVLHDVQVALEQEIIAAYRLGAYDEAAAIAKDLVENPPQETVLVKRTVWRAEPETVRIYEYTRG
jgi:hypothetical protein